MVNPRIVYCNKKHIYDAALDKYCPYCKKIEEEHKRLSKIVRGSKVIDENKNEEHTELIDNREQDEEEYTELIKSVSGGIVPDVRSEEGGEYTELIASQGSEDGEEYTELIASRGSEGEEEYTELIASRGSEEEEYTELIASRGSEEEEYTELITSRGSEEEEYTALIDSNGSEGIRELADSPGEEEKEYAEFINQKRNDEKADTYFDEEGDETELLVKSGDTYEPDKYEIIKLRGWLVCVSGGDLGKSFELSAGDNFVYKEKGNKISVSGTAQDNKRLLGLLGLLCCQEESGVFVIESHTNSECIVDGTQITNECILKSYSRIRWEQMEFIFVKFLNTGFSGGL